MLRPDEVSPAEGIEFARVLSKLEGLIDDALRRGGYPQVIAGVAAEVVMARLLGDGDVEAVHRGAEEMARRYREVGWDVTWDGHEFDVRGPRKDGDG